MPVPGCLSLPCSKKDGYDVLTAENGAVGLKLAQGTSPT